jgi:hypothetical protein
MGFNVLRENPYTTFSTINNTVIDNPIMDTTTTCQYEFSRGGLRGIKCGQPVANNGRIGADRYCRDCLKKNNVLRSLNL